VSSTDERTGNQTASSAPYEPHAPAAAAGRPRSSRASPKTAMTAAATSGMTTGPRTAADGISRLFSGGQPPERLSRRVRTLVQVRHDLRRSLGLEVGICELGLHLRQVLLEPLPFLLSPRVAGSGREADAAGRDREWHTTLHLLHQLDLPEASRKARDPTAHALEVKMPASRRSPRRLPVTADLFHDRHDLLELFLRPGVDEPVEQFRPVRSHDVIAISRQARPQLFGDERHER